MSRAFSGKFDSNDLDATCDGASLDGKELSAAMVRGGMYGIGTDLYPRGT